MLAEVREFDNGKLGNDVQDHSSDFTTVMGTLMDTQKTAGANIIANEDAWTVMLTGCHLGQVDNSAIGSFDIRAPALTNATLESRLIRIVAQATSSDDLAIKSTILASFFARKLGLHFQRQPSSRAPR